MIVLFTISTMRFTCSSMLIPVVSISTASSAFFKGECFLVQSFLSRSNISAVRKKLVQYQRDMAEGIDVVLEGRDIGTVVFPNAEYKFFLIADIHERAKRRKKEMDARGEVVSLEELTSEMEKRDRKDSTRRHSPLRKAEDAVEIDTTGISIEEQVNRIVEIVNKTIK